MAELSSLSMPMWRIECRTAENDHWYVSELMTAVPTGARLKYGMRPKGQTVSYDAALDIFTTAKKQKSEFARNTYLYRLRNIRTGDIIMGAIL